VGNATAVQTPRGGRGQEEVRLRADRDAGKDRGERVLDLGSGRILTSETGVPNILANMGWSG
jgi:hypothetical protein